MRNICWPGLMAVAGFFFLLLTACGSNTPAPATFTPTSVSQSNTPVAQRTEPMQPPVLPTIPPEPQTQAVAIGPTLPPPPTFTLSPTPQPTATRFFPTSSIRRRMTLPPSWTPTPTSTITLTPTTTLTPTLTITPSLTPTRSLATLCEGVVAVLQTEPGRVYTFDDAIDFVIASDDPTVDFEMAIANEDAGFEEVISLEGGQAILGQFVLGTLEDAGTYTWAVTASRGTNSGLCEQSYTFAIRQPSLFESLVDAISTVNARTDTTPSAADGTPVPSSIPPSPTLGLLIPPEVEATLDVLLQTPMATVTASPVATQGADNTAEVTTTTP